MCFASIQFKTNFKISELYFIEKKKKYEIDHDDRETSPTVERDDLAVTSKLPREKIQRYNAWVIERDNEKSSLLWFKTQFVGRWRASACKGGLMPEQLCTYGKKLECTRHTEKKRESAGRAIKKGRKERGVKAKRAKQFKAIRPRCCPLWPRRFIVAGANDRKGTREMLECITAYFTRGCTSQGGS